MYKERRLMNNYYNIHNNELIVLNKIYLNDVAKMLMLNVKANILVEGLKPLLVKIRKLFY